MIILYYNSFTYSQTKVFSMKEYDFIAIGTGSVMDIINAIIQENPNVKVAVIDKDEPGGICLTRGCIPSKILLYPAKLLRTIARAKEFGISINVKNVNFRNVMERMRTLTGNDINALRQGLSNSKNIDYYKAVAEFTAPYTLKVGDETITSKVIFLCTGSKPVIRPIKGIEEAGYLTSDTILGIDKLPESIAIIGGGYIAAEYGHFLATIGSKVTVIGRNPQFIPEEEPEVSLLAKRELQKYMIFFTSSKTLVSTLSFS